MRNLRSLFTIIAATALLAACDDATGPHGTGQLRLQLATSGVGAALRAAPGMANAEAELVITEVAVVARKIRLKQADGTCGEGEGEDPGCPNIWLGPALLEPPVVDGAEVEFTVDLPEGEYREFQMQIHKPTGSGDQAFLTENPDWNGLSVRVTGTVDGEDFTFESSITSVIKVALEAPAEVVEGQAVGVTLLIDVMSWFDDGGSLLDPRNPSQQVRSRIEQNIRTSFRAFHDSNGDGEADGT